MNKQERDTLLEVLARGGPITEGFRGNFCKGSTRGERPNVHDTMGA